MSALSPLPITTSGSPKLRAPYLSHDERVLFNSCLRSAKELEHIHGKEQEAIQFWKNALALDATQEAKIRGRIHKLEARISSGDAEDAGVNSCIDGISQLQIHDSSSSSSSTVDDTHKNNDENLPPSGPRESKIIPNNNTPQAATAARITKQIAVSTPSSPDCGGYSIAELLQMAGGEAKKPVVVAEEVPPLRKSTSTSSSSTTTTITTASSPSTSNVITEISSSTSLISVPVPSPSPSVLIIDGYTFATQKSKWAELDGGFRMPKKLFETLYSYQRQGVAWMWSLHAASPIAAGSIGRDAEDATAGAASAAAALGAALPGTGADGKSKLSGGILADDMGLGKTVQVVSFISSLFHSEKIETALIVLPVSLIIVWANEFKRFAPELRVCVLHDVPDVKKREKLVKACVRDGGVLLTTYGLLQSKPHVFGASVIASEAEAVEEEEGGGEQQELGEEEEEQAEAEEKAENDENDTAGEEADTGAKQNENDDEDGSVSLADLKKASTAAIGKKKPTTSSKAAGKKAQAKPAAVKKKKKAITAPQTPVNVVWDIMILDEGHKIKNPSTLAAKALRAIPSRFRLLLSGTPIQNNMDELWSLFDFTHCGRLLDTRRRFNKEIGDRILKARDKKATASERNDGMVAMNELMALIGPYILRREKEKLLVKPATNNDAITSMEEGSLASLSSSSSESCSSTTGEQAPTGLLALAASSRPETGIASTAMGMMGMKKEVVLWTSMAESQLALYKQYLSSGIVEEALTAEKGGAIISAISMLKKISSHPELISPARRERILAGNLQPPKSSTTTVSTAKISSSDDVAEVDDAEEDEDEEQLEQEDDEGKDKGEKSTDVFEWDVSELPDASTLIAESEKARLFALLLRLLAKEGRKALVFSQSARMLDILQLITRDLYRVTFPSVTAANGNSGEGTGITDLSSFDSNRPCDAFCTQVNGGTVENPHGLRSRRVDGSMKQDERARAVHRFNTDPSVAVCFLTTGVGSLGITLTAATSVIVYDVSWNPAVDAQAVDRAYRVGQTKDVVTYRLISAGTVEEKMYRQQVFKNGLTATVMSARNNATKNQSAVRIMTKDDLAYLLQLGPTSYSQTQQMVQDVLRIAPPLIKSREIRSHLDALATLPISTACVGLSHHDNLFSLAPEEQQALARVHASDLRGAVKKRKGTGGDGGATEETIINNGFEQQQLQTATFLGAAPVTSVEFEMPLVHPNASAGIVMAPSTRKAKRATTKKSKENGGVVAACDSQNSNHDAVGAGAGSITSLHIDDDDDDDEEEAVDDNNNMMMGTSNDPIHITEDEENEEDISVIPTVPPHSSSSSSSSFVANSVLDLMNGEFDTEADAAAAASVILSPEAELHAASVLGTISPRASLGGKGGRRSSSGLYASSSIRFSLGGGGGIELAGPAEEEENDGAIAHTDLDEENGGQRRNSQRGRPRLSMGLLFPVDDNDDDDQQEDEVVTGNGKGVINAYETATSTKSNIEILRSVLNKIQNGDDTNSQESPLLSSPCVDEISEFRALHAAFQLGFLTKQ